MSNTTRSTAQTPTVADEVAVATFAPEGTGESVARLVLRAQLQGYDVIIGHQRERGTEVTAFADKLGVELICTQASESEVDKALDELVSSARALEYAGVIVHQDPHSRVDYEATVVPTDKDEYAVESVTAADSPASPSRLVGIPAYNESETIAPVVDAANEFADSVVVVDDGSDDDTAITARNAGAVVVSHDRNQGYGAAIQTVFKQAKSRGADHLVVMDADGQHDPADIEKLVETQKQSEAEIVIGSRFVDDGTTDAPLYRLFGIRVVNMLTNVSTGSFGSESWVSDTQSGFRVYDETAIESLADDSDIGCGMSASTDILYHANENGYDVEEVGTTVTYDVVNANKHNPLSHGMSLLNNILQTVERDRPIMILGLPGFFGTVIGLGFGYWTITNYMSTETFPLGLAITSAIFGLAGIFACFTAIILHALNHHEDL